MEQRGAELDRESLSCSFCLGLLKDPVTIPCGHRCCTDCIQTHWDEAGEEHKLGSCPQCRKSFTLRPDLVKSTMLAVLVDELKQSEVQAAPADLCSAGPEDVACDLCTGEERKALKSCLQCLTSYCEKHLQPHYDVPPLKRHKLMEPSKNLPENICPRHKEVKKIFCRTDQQIICYLCSMDEHKGHDTVSAAAERTERQRELELSRQNLQQRIQDREKDVKVLQQEVEAINGSADKTVEDFEKIFTELIRLMEKRFSDAKQQVRAKQETEVSRVKELQEKLEQEITELKRKDAELEKLSHTEDHNQFLHSYPSESPCEAADQLSISICPQSYFEDVTAAASEVRQKLQDTLEETWPKISIAVAEVDVLLPQPKTRAEFLKYSNKLTMDSNTAYRHLRLCSGNRRAERVHPVQTHSRHPDRFIYANQVLSEQSLTGRCYWEVQWNRADSGVGVAVAYKDISRDSSGTESSSFGRNNKSWELSCKNSSYGFWHNSVNSPVSGPQASRLGVYLDHSAGLLSFYSVAETMTLLHKIQATFTQPLYAGLCIPYGSTAEFCHL